MELLFILATVIIRNEQKDDFTSPVNSGSNANNTNNHTGGSPDWKIQNMMNAISEARKAKIYSPAELDERLKHSGAQLNKLKAEVRKNASVLEKMSPIKNALDARMPIQDLYETMTAMPQSEEKIEDFLKRYEKNQKDAEILEKKRKEESNRYRDLKRLKHNLHLAVDEHYCYGDDCLDMQRHFTPEKSQ